MTAATVNETPQRECAWCGADVPQPGWVRVRWYQNRSGEWFCNPSHRSQSNAAKRRFLKKMETAK